MHKTRKWSLALLICGLALGLACPAFAAGQDPKTAAGKDEKAAASKSEMVVTATKTEENIYEVPSTTFVVTDQEIKEKVQWSLDEALRDVPGLYFRSNGPFGGATSFSMRGSGSDQVRVMMDGVRIADPIATGGGLNLSTLQTGGIGRVEVVQGPQSPLYGSDAMAGAINIITRRGKGDPSTWASAGYGSHNTFRGELGAQGQVDRFNFMITGTGIDTDGISKAKVGSEDDGYYGYQFNGRFGYDINDNTEVYFIGYYNKSKIEYDGFSGSTQVDTDDWQKTDSYTGILGLTNAPLDWWNHKLTFSYGGSKRDYKDSSSFDSNLTTAEWQHNLLYKDMNTLTLGVDWEQEKGKTSGPYNELPEKKATVMGLYAQDQLKVFKGLYLLGGVRNDNHDEYGNRFTWRTGASYTYEPSGTIFKGTYGTGFKSPTLYQLYSSYGNKDLDPQKSKGWDLGVVQKLWSERIVTGLTYFDLKTDNLISWDFNTWKYANISQAKSSGLEFFVKADITKWLQADFSWTYTNSENQETGKDLRYTPRDKGTLGLRMPFLDNRLNIRLWALYVGNRYSDDANTTEVDSYVTVNSSATYKVNDWLSVFGNLVNMFDENYVEIEGYNTLGLSGFLGVRIELP